MIFAALNFDSDIKAKNKPINNPSAMDVAVSSRVKYAPFKKSGIELINVSNRWLKLGILTTWHDHF